MRPLAAATLLTLLLSSCTSGRWQYVRERPPQNAETEVTVTSEPPGAEVFLNGDYMGPTPFVVPVKYPYTVRVYERREALPYLHVESKEVNSYYRNVFTLEFRLMGHDPVKKERTLNGEKTATVSATLR